MTADLKTVSLPRILLLASPDDFLLELERREVVDVWQSANPHGEIVSFDQAPSATRLVQELASPSLFASDRLIVLTDASAYFAPGRRSEAEDLAGGLASLPLAGVTLLLSAVSSSALKGALVDAVTGRGEVRFLPLPEAPKPWEEGRISGPQRRTLAGLVAKVAPALADNDEVVDALCEVYGFRPRELAQAAERLTLAGEATATAVRTQAGAGERQLRDLEEALQQRDPGRFVRFASALDAGATLTDWRGAAVAPDGFGRVLASTVGRLLRQALAVRGHAARAGLARELDAKRCGGKDWYPRAFKPRILGPLSKDIEATSDSPLAGMTPWQLHRAFRLGAVYRDEELIAALARLSGAQVERSRGPAVLSSISSIVLRLMALDAA
ncbi:MAG: hypothetical protein ABR961_01240 [Thermoanaerobaculaceae bacterium]|jgi:hypothetical protein